MAVPLQRRRRHTLPASNGLANRQQGLLGYGADFKETTDLSRPALLPITTEMSCNLVNRCAQSVGRAMERWLNGLISC